MITRNYAKGTDRLFTRIIGKVSVLTILQYINYKNGTPIGRVKYTLIQFCQRVVFIIYLSSSL